MEGFSGGSDGKESDSDSKESPSVRFLGSIPGLDRYPGEGNGYSFQYSCRGNSMDKGVW